MIVTIQTLLLGMPPAVGFVLGAIVAPPDAVAPLSVMRQLGVPRRLTVILQGEGVANDATALILYRFAVAAAGTGLFSLGQAAGTFVLIVVGEIAYGIGIGWLSLRLRRWTRDPRAEITLSLLTPYAAFLLPAHLGGSGILATVAAGLFSQLERAAAHSNRDAAARNLLACPPRLSRRAVGRSGVEHARSGFGGGRAAVGIDRR
jgi:monovalent cation/hydrogen antiporter